jgi:hypothetical protein
MHALAYCGFVALLVGSFEWSRTPAPPLLVLAMAGLVALFAGAAGSSDVPTRGRRFRAACAAGILSGLVVWGAAVLGAASAGPGSAVLAANPTAAAWLGAAFVAIGFVAIARGGVRSKWPGGGVPLQGGPAHRAPGA